MSVVVFSGPTLRAADLSAYPDFTFRPPVRQGELYAAARTRPKAIGIVDGYFDGVPAVWHKEVLWALANGIAVFGASSMGALRAAELHMFGMRGVGRIFEDYRDGRLTDDDEVALLHGPAETGYLALSEPMVNVRATLERALAEGVLDAVAADALAAVAKAQFYQERTWRSVLESAAGATPDAALERFASWLPAGKIDRKREDARDLLAAIEDFVSHGENAPPASFAFEWTETWANAPWLNAPADAEDGRDEGGEAVLDELRLEEDAYQRVRQAALLQLLASDEIARGGVEPDRKQIARAAMAFRLQRGLTRRSEAERWAAENGIDAARFEQLMADRAGLEKLARARDAELRPQMLDQLRLEDAYPALRERARAKARAAGAAAPEKVPPPVLVSWYFGTRLGTTVPEDLAGYAAGLGLADLDRFYDLLAAEYSMAERGKQNPSGRRKK